ncbi:hypothetical protein, variant [Aphanomyces invadans]|uniref:AB hydrolase-1 domain-containing protein n=1 Tax=Aphanomyces invadans TaxID=157072 RepID=A0A024UVA9_9STRA|nr:hypothetical protein, variant [Aphanomyces invadans]ETW10431.1 hypothetical protein, variant [Aphanomyces invadans]|eukprot:XP_008861842.1 hypothetical protein, variant [Aphanomyces invadans]
MKYLVVPAAVAALANTLGAQKINGWYPCNLRTFATPAPAPSPTSSGQANNVESLTLRGWRFDDQNPANAIFRSLIVNPATDISITLGAAAATSAECAEITMPLCHEGICASNGTINVFVKRMRAARGRSNASAKSLWVLQGGPGASSVNMEGIMAALYDAPGSYLGGAVDVYTMDHRGTGRSGLLSCVASQVETSGSPTKGSVNSQSFPACIQDVNTQLGDDADVNLLKAYSTTSAATDLSNLISLFGTTGGETTVYGVSYGTYLVQRLMQLGNPNVKGYVLDGVVSQSGSKVGEKLSFADWSVNMNEIGQTFLAQCGKDAFCSAKFSTSTIQDTLKSIYTSLDAKPKGTACGAFLQSLSSMPPSYLLRQLFGQLLQSQAVRSFIPVLIYRINRCNSNDATAVSNFITAYYNIIGASDESDALDSSMLYNLVALSELFTFPTPTRATLQQRFINTSIASDTSNLVTMYCLASGGKDPGCASERVAPSKYRFIYPTDKYFDVPITIPAGTSVLLMSGLLDPQTPPKFAKYQLNSFVGTAKKLIEFPTSAHGTILNTPVTLQVHFHRPFCA